MAEGEGGTAGAWLAWGEYFNKAVTTVVEYGVTIVKEAPSLFLSDSGSEDSEEEVVSEDEFHDAEEHVAPPDHLHQICLEMLTTEEEYVRRLRILLQAKEKASGFMSKSEIRTIFMDIQTIYDFHSDHVLPELRYRMQYWEIHRRIGNIWTELAPFLKLYTEYMKGFEKATRSVLGWEKKAAFQQLIRQIMGDPKYLGLTLRDMMIAPVQRVPRYQLFLQDYIRHLPENSPDKEDVANAFKTIEEAAQHFEKMMNYDVAMVKLIELQKRMDGYDNIVHTNRKYIEEGKMRARNPYNNSTTEMVYHLFNDILLFSIEKSTFSLQTRYSVQFVFTLTSMKMTEGFYEDETKILHLQEKHAVELLFDTEEVMADWIKIVRHFIEMAQIAQSETEEGSEVSGAGAVPQVGRVGLIPPILVHKSKVTNCASCQVAFSLSKKKHHCKVCGKVVCAACADRRMPLLYNKSPIHRTCDNCLVLVWDDQYHGEQNTDEVEITVAGYVVVRTDPSQTWEKRFCAVVSSNRFYHITAKVIVLEVPLIDSLLEDIRDVGVTDETYLLRHGDDHIYLRVLDTSAESDISTRFFTSLKEAVQQCNPNDVLRCKPEDKLHHIAHELMTTEAEYVKRLTLLVKTKEKAATMLKEDEVQTIFLTVDNIFTFHTTYLLPELKKRLQKWSKEMRIGDLMVQVAPYLKIYSDYLMGLEKAIQTVEEWEKRTSTDFGKFLALIKRDPRFGQLNLQSVMVVPMQRVTKYELLLQDYHKNLEPNSPDKADVEKAKKIMTDVGKHLNNMVGWRDAMHKLHEIQTQLEGPQVTVVKTTRRFIKKGDMMIVNPKDSVRVDMVYLLFNDLLLVCRERPTSPPKYNVNFVYDLPGTRIVQMLSPETGESVYLIGGSEAIETVFRSSDDKEAFLSCISDKVGSCTKVTPGVGGACTPAASSSPFIPGVEPPVLDRFEGTDRCTACSQGFSTFKIRHHCRSCGRVVCWYCSNHQLALPYDTTRSHRICDDCRITIHDRLSSSDKTKDHVECLQRGMLEMSHDGRRWERRLCSLLSNSNLYFITPTQKSELLR